MIALLLALQVAGAGDLARPITRPVWVHRPSNGDMISYYPSGASREKLAAIVRLECTVDRRGDLGTCKVIHETTPDRGFGEAALRISKVFRMQVKDATGAPTDGRSIRIPIAFLQPVGRAAPVKVRAEGLEGALATIDCRVRGGQADNCLYLRGSLPSERISDLAVSIGPQIKFDPSLDGRFQIPIQFVGP